MSLKISFKTSKNFEGIIPEPIPAYKCFPEWFSSLPKSTSKCPFAAFGENIYNLQYNPKNGIGGCLGIQDFLKFGYIIPSWSSFVFREDFDGKLYVNWVGNPVPTNYTIHGSEQFSTMKNPPLYDHFGKIDTPWIIETSPGVSCLITDPIWHRNKNFTTSTGIFHTDKSPLGLPWFFEWNYKIDSQMSLGEDFSLEDQVIDVNQPLILIIPFYRKNFESKVQYIDGDEFTKMKLIQCAKTHKITVDGPYRKFRKMLKILFK